MDTYEFKVARDEVLKGFVEAESKAQAIQKIFNLSWNEIIDLYDCEVLSNGYEILEIRKGDCVTNERI